MGSYATHIANDSERVLWASVDGSAARMIPPRDFQKFEYGKSVGRVYITIDVEEQHGEKRSLVTNLERGGDASVLVQADLRVVDSKYGNIWEPK